MIACLLRLRLGSEETMELIVISDTRLKIVLTPKDMEAYALDFEDTYENGSARESIIELFRDVKKRCGFDIADERVVVQVWQSADGGCELYISKSDGSDKMPVNQKRERQVRYIKQTYVFDDLNALLTVCRALLAKSYGRTSDAYVGDDDKWYLVLEAESVRDKPHDLSFVEEYAVKQGSALANLVLVEHAKLVAHTDAVGVLAPLA